MRGVNNLLVIGAMRRAVRAIIGALATSNDEAGSLSDEPTTDSGHLEMQAENEMPSQIGRSADDDIDVDDNENEDEEAFESAGDAVDDEEEPNNIAQVADTVHAHGSNRNAQNTSLCADRELGHTGEQVPRVFVQSQADTVALASPAHSAEGKSNKPENDFYGTRQPRPMAVANNDPRVVACSSPGGHVVETEPARSVHKDGIVERNENSDMGAGQVLPTGEIHTRERPAISQAFVKGAGLIPQAESGTSLAAASTRERERNLVGQPPVSDDPLRFVSQNVINSRLKEVEEASMLSLRAICGELNLDQTGSEAALRDRALGALKNCDNGDLDTNEEQFNDIVGNNGRPIRRFVGEVTQEARNDSDSERMNPELPTIQNKNERSSIAARLQMLLNDPRRVSTEDSDAYLSHVNDNAGSKLVARASTNVFSQKAHEVERPSESGLASRVGSRKVPTSTENSACEDQFRRTSCVVQSGQHYDGSAEIKPSDGIPTRESRSQSVGEKTRHASNRSELISSVGEGIASRAEHTNTGARNSSAVPSQRDIFGKLGDTGLHVRSVEQGDHKGEVNYDFQNVTDPRASAEASRANLHNELIDGDRAGSFQSTGQNELEERSGRLASSRMMSHSARSPPSSNVAIDGSVRNTSDESFRGHAQATGADLGNRYKSSAMSGNESGQLLRKARISVLDRGVSDDSQLGKRSLAARDNELGAIECAPNERDSQTQWLNRVLPDDSSRQFKRRRHDDKEADSRFDDSESEQFATPMHKISVNRDLRGTLQQATQKTPFRGLLAGAVGGPSARNSVVDEMGKPANVHASHLDDDASGKVVMPQRHADANSKSLRALTDDSLPTKWQELVHEPTDRQSLPEVARVTEPGSEFAPGEITSQVLVTPDSLRQLDSQFLTPNVPGHLQSESATRARLSSSHTGQHLRNDNVPSQLQNSRCIARPSPLRPERSGLVTPQDIIRTLQNRGPRVRSSTDRSLVRNLNVSDAVDGFRSLGSAFKSSSQLPLLRTPVSQGTPADRTRSSTANIDSDARGLPPTRRRVLSSTGGLVTDLRQADSGYSASREISLSRAVLRGQSGLMRRLGLASRKKLTAMHSSSQSVATSSSTRKILESLDRVSKENRLSFTKRHRSPLGPPPSSKRRRTNNGPSMDGDASFLGSSQWLRSSLDGQVLSMSNNARLLASRREGPAVHSEPQARGANDDVPHAAVKARSDVPHDIADGRSRETNNDDQGAHADSVNGIRELRSGLRRKRLVLNRSCAENEDQQEIESMAQVDDDVPETDVQSAWRDSGVSKPLMPGLSQGSGIAKKRRHEPESVNRKQGLAFALATSRFPAVGNDLASPENYDANRSSDALAVQGSSFRADNVPSGFHDASAHSPIAKFDDQVGSGSSLQQLGENPFASPDKSLFSERSNATSLLVPEVAYGSGTENSAITGRLDSSRPERKAIQADRPPSNLSTSASGLVSFQTSSLVESASDERAISFADSTPSSLKESKVVEHQEGKRKVDAKPESQETAVRSDDDSGADKRRPVSPSHHVAAGRVVDVSNGSVLFPQKPSTSLFSPSNGQKDASVDNRFAQKSNADEPLVKSDVSGHPQSVPGNEARAEDSNARSPSAPLQKLPSLSFSASEAARETKTLFTSSFGASTFGAPVSSFAPAETPSIATDGARQNHSLQSSPQLAEQGSRPLNAVRSSILHSPSDAPKAHGIANIASSDFSQSQAAFLFSMSTSQQPSASTSNLSKSENAGIFSTGDKSTLQPTSSLFGHASVPADEPSDKRVASNTDHSLSRAASSPFGSIPKDSDVNACDTVSGDVQRDECLQSQTPTTAPSTDSASAGPSAEIFGSLSATKAEAAAVSEHRLAASNATSDPHTDPNSAKQSISASHSSFTTTGSTAPALSSFTAGPFGSVQSASAFSSSSAISSATTFTSSPALTQTASSTVSLFGTTASFQPTFGVSQPSLFGGASFSAPALSTTAQDAKPLFAFGQGMSSSSSSAPDSQPAFGSAVSAPFGGFGGGTENPFAASQTDKPFLSSLPPSTGFSNSTADGGLFTFGAAPLAASSQAPSQPVNLPSQTQPPIGSMPATNPFGSSTGGLGSMGSAPAFGGFTFGSQPATALSAPAFGNTMPFSGQTESFGFGSSSTPSFGGSGGFGNPGLNTNTPETSGFNIGSSNTAPAPRRRTLRGRRSIR